MLYHPVKIEPAPGMPLADEPIGQPLKPRSLHPSILREYDIRGIVGETLFAEDALAIGRAFGTAVRRHDFHRVVVGYDGRLSSPELVANLTRGLMDVGIEVLSIGCGPSPMLYLAEHALEADAGIMVTGSHNPAEYNGFKMVMGHKPFFGSQISRLACITASGSYAAGNGSFSSYDFLDIYVEHVAQAYEGTRDLKVAWDAGNGASGEAMSLLVDRLPGEHILLNETIDGTFPNHHPDPTVPANLAQLRETVLSEECDLGVAFDGDGDRIGVVDDKGEILWGDQLMMLWAEDVLSDNPGATIIADVKASNALFGRIEQLGGKPLMWRTGHSLIKTKMAETKSPLAGEMSGHIFFADRNLGFDDALYAAVRLLRIVASKDDALSEYREAMPKLHNTPEIRIPCDESQKNNAVSQIACKLQDEGAEVDDIDGVRVSTPDGWWLLRASNTQAVLVARCESESVLGLARLESTVATHLEACGIALPLELK